MPHLFILYITFVFVYSISSSGHIINGAVLNRLTNNNVTDCYTISDCIKISDACYSRKQRKKQEINRIKYKGTICIIKSIKIVTIISCCVPDIRNASTNNNMS